MSSEVHPARTSWWFTVSLNFEIRGTEKYRYCAVRSCSSQAGVDSPAIDLRRQYRCDGVERNGNKPKHSLLVCVAFGLCTSTMKSISNSKLNLQEFSEHTTVHGLPKILSNESTLSKTVWLLLFLCATGLFLLQAITLLDTYFDRPVQTVLKAESLKEFPSVTVCSLRNIDPVLNFLFVKSSLGELPSDCRSPGNDDDGYLCFMVDKYKQELEVYNKLRTPYNNVAKIKSDPALDAPLYHHFDRNEYLVTALNNYLGSRVTFAANVLHSNLISPTKMGFDFDHFMMKCRFGSHSCASMLLDDDCGLQRYVNQTKGCTIRDREGFRQLYDPRTYNCYTFNTTQFLMRQYKASSVDELPPPMTGPESGFDFAVLADGMYAPTRNDSDTKLGGIGVRTTTFCCCQ